MRNSTLRYLLLVSVLLNLTIVGTAGYRYYQHNDKWTSPFGHRLPRDRFLFEELALAPRQVEALKKKTVPFRAELDRQRTHIAENRRELVAMMRRDNPDLPAIRALIFELSVRQEEMQQRVAAHMLEVKTLLNKEEQQRFFDLIENAMSKGKMTGCPSVE
ncbi:MAG: hypothetical protein A2512_12360 [Deltaproteobacteria bacterium RIFOXYD12_FULL_56_24]|nr:MAG: hypothetical protein A2512_12360 [Deltaproteobacteria bacterium RIFOXYD12_FULL_56_24]